MKKRRIYCKSDKKITLYDSKMHSKIEGTIVFSEISLITRFRTYDKMLRKLYPRLAWLFLLVSFITIFSVVTPILATGFNSLIAKPLPKPTVIDEKKWNGESLAEFDSRDSQEKEKLVIKDFRIVIPKININSNIIDNVDTQKEKEYKEQLKNGVAHAKGSYLPNENGPVYLFSHSTDSIFNITQYNAQFYALKELAKDDSASIFLNGKEYKYRVTAMQILNPEEIEVIRQTKADLIMQTCWPPGTDWQRLIVYADKVD